MKTHNTIIIGAGASGCMCAIATQNKDVAIIDSNYQIAKKILVTGNGKCNLTNINTNSTKYNCNIDKYLKKFSVDDTLSFFQDLGLETYTDDMGRVYPISNSAKSVVDILERAVISKATVYNNTLVQKISKTNTGFEIVCNNETFSCNNLVLATGGNTIDLLKGLSIQTTPISHSLVALHTNSTKNLNNVRLSNVKVTATCNNTTMEDVGEVLFKDSGVSGIVSFNLSTLFSRQHNFSGNISIDLLPNMSTDDLKEMLIRRKSLNLPMHKYFVGLFQNQVADEILRQSKLNTNKISNYLASSDIEVLISTIKSLSFEVDGHYDNNQVYSGGISLIDLSDHLEHKNIPNLYITGELCDVDGECGGYNLQWAWTSGHIVGENL